MNVYDGERMAELMEAEGMTASDKADADLVILNTCHIRERAAEKVYSEIGRLRRDDGSKPVIAVAGCVAQEWGKFTNFELGTRIPLIFALPPALHPHPGSVSDALVDISLQPLSKTCLCLC